MTLIEKLRVFFIIAMFLCVLIFGIIPTIKESKRKKNITQSMVENYINNSEDIVINNISIIDTQDFVIYANATFLNRHDKKKSILILQDIITNIYYQVDFYNNYFTGLNWKSGKPLYLTINKEDNIGKGSKEDPVRVLRIYTNPLSKNYYIESEGFPFTVQQYLTYKDFKPINSTPRYSLGFLFFVLLMGILITTTAPAKYRSGYQESDSSKKEKQGKKKY